MAAQLVEHVIGLLLRLCHAHSLREEVSAHLKARSRRAVGILVKLRVVIDRAHSVAAAAHARDDKVHISARDRVPVHIALILRHVDTDARAHAGIVVGHDAAVLDERRLIIGVRRHTLEHIERVVLVVDLLLLVERAELIDAVNDRRHLRARDAAVGVEIRQVADLRADEHTRFIERRHIAVVHVGKRRGRVGCAIAQRLGRKARHIKATDAVVKLIVAVILRGKAHGIGVGRVAACPVRRAGLLLLVAGREQHELEHFARARGTVGGKRAVAVAADDALLAQLHDIVIEPVGLVDVGIGLAGVARRRPLRRDDRVAVHDAVFRDGLAVARLEAGKAVAELFRFGEATVGLADLVDGKVRLVGRTAFHIDDEIRKLVLRRAGAVI